MTKLRAYTAVHGTRIAASWHGGEYIELHFNSIDSVPFDVINVWDYELGKPSIQFGKPGLRYALDTWAEGVDAEELENFRSMV